MEALSKHNREVKGEFNIMKRDPVITYDHMSEALNNHYFGVKHPSLSSTKLRFILEEMLIVGLLILAVYICL